MTANKKKLTAKNLRYHQLFEQIRLTLALQISGLRKNRGWTQADLAKNAGITLEQVVRLENAHRGIWRISTLEKIANAFDVALIIRFESWSDYLNNSHSPLIPLSYEEEVELEIM